MEPRAWSYSALSAFETCPRQYFLTKVTKEVKEEESQALRWGNTAHKMLENRVKANKPLPETMEQHEPLIAKLVKLPGEIKPEWKLAFTREMKLTDFFAKDVWLRGVFDLTVIQDKKALILDWKTGKRRPNSDQLKLFALMAFYALPKIDRVDTAFYWLNQQTQDIEHFTRKPGALTRLWDNFLPRVSRLEQAFVNENFPAKPSGLCRGWCPCTSCPHHEGRR